jgi:RHS repeat-associated protein
VPHPAAQELSDAETLTGITDKKNGVLSPAATDLNGRLRQLKLPGQDPQTFEWDTAGRLSAVSMPTPADPGFHRRTEYAYDSRNWRVSSTTRRIPDPDTAGIDPVLHSQRFAWGADGVVAETVGNAWAAHSDAAGMVAAVGPQLMAHDALGSAVGQISAGTMQPRQLDAFGNYVSGAPQPGEATPGFAGQAWDPDAALSYAQQRWYHRQLGRFLSEDPLGATTDRLASGRDLDGFAYAGANPARWLDPTGEKLEGPSDYLRVLFGGEKYFKESDFADYNNNPTAHNWGFASSFVGAAGLAAAGGLELAVGAEMLAEVPLVANMLVAAAPELKIAGYALLAQGAYYTARDVGACASDKTNTADRWGACIRTRTTLLSVGLGAAESRLSGLSALTADEAATAAAEADAIRKRVDEIAREAGRLRAAVDNAAASAESQVLASESATSSGALGADAIGVKKSFIPADTVTERQRLTTYYPPNRGFLEPTNITTLKPGTQIERWGFEGALTWRPGEHRRKWSLLLTDGKQSRTICTKY